MKQFNELFGGDKNSAKELTKVEKKKLAKITFNMYDLVDDVQKYFRKVNWKARKITTEHGKQLMVATKHLEESEKIFKKILSEL